MKTVPFFSQYDESIPESWRPRACSVTNLFMVLTAFGVENISIEELIREGEKIGAFGPRGWTHEGIIWLAHNHGVSAYNQEFRSQSVDVATGEKVEKDTLIPVGIEKIRTHVEKGLPVIVSIQKDNGSFHTVTIVGRKEEGFQIHDPEEKNPTHISDSDFFKKWRRFSVFFE